jgi:hypothetical protein
MFEIGLQLRRSKFENKKVKAIKIQTNCYIDVALRFVQRALSCLGFSLTKVNKKLLFTRKHKRNKIEK